jgi:cytochrome P450
LIPLTLDPPDHTRVRRALQPFFTARTAARLMGPLRARLSGIIDGFIDRGSCDVVEELAIPFPADASSPCSGFPSRIGTALSAGRTPSSIPWP